LPAAVRFEVRFDELAFTDELAHASPAAREVAHPARQRLETAGADPVDF